MTIEPRAPVEDIDPIIVASSIVCSDPDNWYVVVDSNFSGDLITSIVAEQYSEPPSGPIAPPPTNTDPITIFPEGYSIDLTENTQGEPTPYRFIVNGTLVRWEELSSGAYRLYIRFPMSDFPPQVVGYDIEIISALTESVSVTETTVNYVYLGHPEAPSIIDSSLSLTTGSNTTKITGISGTIQPNRSGSDEGSISFDNGANRCEYYTCEWQIELPVNTSLDPQPVVSPDPTPTTRWVSLPWTKTHVSNTGLDTTMAIPNAALFVPPNMNTVKFRSTARISTMGASETQTYTVTSNTLPNVEIGSPIYTLNEAITFEEGNPVSIKVTPTRNTTPVDFAYYTVQDQQGEEWITIYIAQWVAQDDGTFQGNGYYSSSNTESLPVGSICWCVWTKEYYQSIVDRMSSKDVALTVITPFDDTWTTINSSYLWNRGTTGIFIISFVAPQYLSKLAIKCISTGSYNTSFGLSCKCVSPNGTSVTANLSMPVNGPVGTIKEFELGSPISYIQCSYSTNLNYAPDIAINLPLTWIKTNGISNAVYDPVPIDNISGDTEVALMYCPDLSQ